MHHTDSTVYRGRCDRLAGVMEETHAPKQNDQSLMTCITHTQAPVELEEEERAALLGHLNTPSQASEHLQSSVQLTFTCHTILVRWLCVAVVHVHCTHTCTYI